MAGLLGDLSDPYVDPQAFDMTPNARVAQGFGALTAPSPSVTEQTPGWLESAAGTPWDRPRPMQKQPASLDTTPSPPVSLAPPSPGPSSNVPETSLAGRLGTGDLNKWLPLILASAGLAGKRSPGEAISGAGTGLATGLQIGRQNQMQDMSQQALYTAALKGGASKEMALAFALNPNAAMATNPKLQQIGTGIFGPQYGVVHPFNSTISAPEASIPDSIRNSGEQGQFNIFIKTKREGSGYRFPGSNRTMIWRGGNLVWQDTGEPVRQQ